jgi:hypothetical protein
MSRATAALLLVAASACQSTPRAAGELATAADLIALARAKDPRGAAAIALAGAQIPFLSDPYSAGVSALEPADRDGLLVQPAFADTHQAALVTTERWNEFPKVWAQPIYIMVTGFDAVGGPQKLAGAAPVFGIGADSRFYSPYWQTQYVTVSPGTAEDAVTSGEQIIARGYPLTPGPLRLCSLVPAGLGLATPDGQSPQHPFTGDPIPQRFPSQAWVDGELRWFLDWGKNRFRMDDVTHVVQEVALFHLSLQAPDGTAQPLPVPPIVGTGPFRGARAADAPNGIPQFGALQHAFTARIAPNALGTTPGIFVSASRPALRQSLIAQVSAALVPLPGLAAERLPEREQYTLRVALDGTCFGDSGFPDTCVWLDSQQQVEGNLPPAAFTDEKVFTGGPLVFFDGLAP